MLRFISNRLVQIILLLALLAGLAFIRHKDPPVIRRMRQITFDMYNRSMPRPEFRPGAASPIKGVAIVDIDEDSIKKYGQWPWPRWLIAKLPDILHQAGAKSTAFDVVFSEPDRTSPSLIADNPLMEGADMATVVRKLKGLPSNEQVFASTIASAGNVVMGFVGANQRTGMKPQVKVGFMSQNDLSSYITKEDNFAVSLDTIVNSAAGNGSFTSDPDSDGVIREVPMLIGAVGDKTIYPALSLEALRVALKDALSPVIRGYNAPEGFRVQDISIGDAKNPDMYTIPTDEKGRFRVYYAGHRPQLYIPAWKVLENKLKPEDVKDKIVLIGTSAIGLLDLRSSPLNTILPGVEIHAEILEQVLSKKFFLYRPSSMDITELVVTIMGSLLVIFLTPFISLGSLMVLVIALIGTSVTGSLYAYQNFGYMLDPVYPSLTITIIFILSSILTNLRTEMERRAVKNAFGHYISPALMEELASDPDKLKLGGEVREISVMFTDIRNFTTIAESMDPAELIRMMNDFLTPMTSCVLNNRGTIDKYMGDAMMAFWNAPLDDPDHALHACTAALQMLEALKAVNAELRIHAEKAGRPFKELRAGIGIHTGRASVGNMGSKQRFAYSALGDTVNLASRLEGQTKGYGISVMISEEVRKQVPTFAAIEIDLLTVKGRKEPERVYALLGDASFAPSPAFREISSLHGDMLAAYRAQQWDRARALAEQCQTLRPDQAVLYALYLQRIADFKTTPPAAGWQGVWVAKEKS